jgi:hypothetical protein
MFHIHPSLYFLDYSDYRRMDEHDQYESVGLDDSLEDERNLDEIMADLRAAEAELDAREVRTGQAADRKLPRMLHDQGNGVKTSSSFVGF